MGRHWLMKSEPSVYSIADLRRDKRTGWEGIRNYQVRNWFRDEVKVGDDVLFYHSNADPMGVAGLARIVGEAYPDESAFDKKSEYYDPKSKKDDPAWLKVDVGFVEQWAEPVTLAEIKADKALDGILVARKGQRLSVQPVTDAHYERIVALGRKKGRVIG